MLRPGTDAKFHCREMIRRYRRHLATQRDAYKPIQIEGRAGQAPPVLR